MIRHLKFGYGEAQVFQKTREVSEELHKAMSMLIDIRHSVSGITRVSLTDLSDAEDRSSVLDSILSAAESVGDQIADLQLSENSSAVVRRLQPAALEPLATMFWDLAVEKQETKQFLLEEEDFQGRFGALGVEFPPK